MSILENPAADYPEIGVYLKIWEGTPFFPEFVLNYPDDTCLERLFRYEGSVEHFGEETIITMGVAWDAGD